MSKRTITAVIAIPAWTHEESHPTALRKLGAGFWPPLALMYLAARLRADGHRVVIYDGGFYTHDQLIRNIVSHDPDLVGIYASTVLWNRSRQTATDLRRLLPGAHITFGGPLPSVIKEEFLENCPAGDSLVVNEGEESLAEMADRLARGETMEGVAGTVYRNGDELVRNPERPYIADLDSLPFPARDMIDHPSYVPPIGLYTKRPLTTMLTSRGCHHKCIYCYKWGGNEIRFRDPVPVAEEMAEAVNRFGIKEIRFWDDTFTAQKDRVLQLAEEVARRKIKVDFSIATRADSLDREVLAALKQMGCYNIMIGVESGVPKNLKTLKKGETREQIREGVAMVHEAGIRSFLTSMFGVPGETYEDGLETIRFVKSLKGDASHFFTISPFPGTELYENLDKYGTVVPGDYSVLGMHTLCFAPHTMTIDQIESLRRRAFLQTTLIPSFLVKRILRLRSWEEVKILCRAGSTIFFAMVPAMMKSLVRGRKSDKPDVKFGGKVC